MTVLTRYLVREIIRHLCIVLGLVIVIYLAVDFFEKFDNFLEAGVPATRAFLYFLFKIPLIVSYMCPISLLLAVLITFGLMSKRNELIALKSSGVSIFHLFKPVAALGILGTLFLCLLSEVVVPASMPHANHIWLQDVKGGGALKTRENIWIKGDRSFFKADQYDPEGQVIFGLTVYDFDEQFRLTRRLDAKLGEYKSGSQWVLQDLMTQEFDPATGLPEVVSSNRETVDIELAPDNLEQVSKETEEMSSKAIQAVIGKIEAEGYDATRYRVDLQYKMAFPVVCLIMCLIGTAIAVRSKLKEGLPLIVSYGIGIAFLYYIVLSFCVSIGYGGVIPPVAAAWSAHIIFLCAGAFLLMNSE
jgi:lipopolysaccharide export system permease protein